jgi:hypothetical protein
MAGTFELYRDKGGEFRFRLKASNGQIILASEGYKAKASALNGIASVTRNAPLEGRFEARASKKGQPYFVLKAGNHQVIGTSETYETERSRDAGMKSVAAHAAGAKTVDLTQTTATRAA